MKTSSGDSEENDKNDTDLDSCWLGYMTGVAVGNVQLCRLSYNERFAGKVFQP